EAIADFRQLVKEFQDNKFVEKLKELLEKFVKESFYIAVTVPTVDADEIKFTVEITPVDKKAKVHHRLEEPVIVKVKRGWKIDFSSGALFLFNAHDRAYRFDDSPGNKDIVTLREDQHKNSITPVVGSLMHVYPRRQRFIFRGVYWSGFSFGLGTGKAESLSYFLGSGVMMGSKRRFVITAGVAAVKHARLLPEYRDKVGQEMTRNDNLTADKLVRSNYKLRAFVSFTYNLGK
ncbi:MAG: hypothetical protein GY950_37620, partial [bacterium]|nr:hypothetical protein [bacterium]